MSIAFSPAHFQPLDRNGSPLRNGRMRFRVPGTLTDIVTYRDAARANPHEAEIRASQAGVFPPVFFSATTYRYDYEVRDVAGNLVFELRDCAVPVASVAPSTAGGTAGIVRKVTSAPATPDEYKTGYVEGAPATSDLIITLPPTAEVVTEECTFKHAGTARHVILVATSGDTIDGNNALAIPVVGSVRLRASNGRYRVISETNRAPHVWIVKSRTINTPPSNPPAGDTYIAPSNAASPWVANKIYVSTGQNSWEAYTPSEGWSAIVLDSTENDMPTTWLFISGSWQKHLSKQVTALRIQAATFALEAPSGTAGSTATTGVWTSLGLNTTVSSTIAGASLASNRITLPVDRYYVHGAQSFLKTGKTQLRLKSSLISTELRGTVIDVTDNTSTDDGIEASFSGFFEVDPASPEVEMQYNVSAAGNLGSAANTGSPERYGVITFIRLTPQVV